MLYEVYQKRIQKIAAFLSALLKLMPLIISIVSAIVLATVALLACKGLPGSVSCASEVIYGDEYTCEAKAFLSDVRIEFCAKDSEEWTEEKPQMPGNYLTRAVGISVFDKDRFGEATEFSILPFPVDVKVKDGSVIYGEIPTVTAQTVYADTFICDNVIFESTVHASTKVKPDITAVKFFDLNGNDVTDAYSINIVESGITFEKRSITVTIESASKEYDDTPLSLDAYALTGGSLAFSDSLGAVFNTSITDVGTVDNIPVFQILQNSEGNAVDVTELYDITTLKGTLTVTTRVLKINTGSLEEMYNGNKISCEEFEIDPETTPLEGHSVTLVTAEGYTDCGTHKNRQVIRITDKNGVDKTSNYAVYYLEGTITITQKPLFITTHDNEWIYDGLTHPKFEITAEGLIEGHRANGFLLTQDTITDVGSSENIFSVSITDTNEKDVSGNYDISYKYGTLTVKPRPITVQTSNAEWIYDGKEHTSPGCVTISQLNLVSGHKLEPLAMTAITDVGKKSNVFSTYKITDAKGNDKTFCYTVTFQSGALEIKKRPITVKPEDTFKVYDATSLYGGEIKLHESSEYQLVAGHTMTAKASGSRTDAGTSKSGLASIVIKDGERDVTKNYSVTTIEGTIIIYPRPITILTGSAEKDYDGKPLTSSKFSVPSHSQYQLVVGHKITIKNTGSQTQIGESSNTCDESKTKITAQNKDVTKNYIIQYELGTLKVNPYAVITILTNSDIKLYDGKPLTNDGYEYVVVRGKLQSGHKLVVDVFGSQTEPGTSPNDATAIMLDSKGKNVTSGYEISISPGTLEVKEADHNESNNAVFGQIKTDKGGTVYLYMRSFGNYSGQLWLGAVDYGKTLPGGYSYNYLTSIAIRNKGTEPAMAEIKDCSLFMLPYYLGFGGNYDIQKSDTSYVSRDSDYSMEYYFPISALNSYEEWKGNLGEYAQYEKEYRKFVYQNYLTVDDETAKYMNTLISQNNFKLSDPNVILKIASYIQNAATYSLEYDPLLDVEENVVIAFLDQYKEGKCVHYASAATLLYRTLGIPARYVEGWMIETVKDQFVDIANPGHAWVEVYIDDLGWVQVEVTGSDPNATGGGGGSGTKQTITLTPKYTYGVYNGRTLFAKNIIEPDATLADLLRKGYTYEAKVSGSLQDVGRSTSTVKDFKLFDPNGNDITDQFNYSREDGIIDIFDSSTKIVKVYLFELQKVYDSTPLTFNNDDYAIIDIESGANLDLSLNISRINAGVLTLSDINKDIGSYATYTVRKDGVNITNKCALVFDTFEHTPNYYVPLRVDPRGVGISSATEVKVDDDKPLSNDNVFISHGSLVPGDTMEAYAIGFIDYVGTVDNEIYSNILIVNNKGEDVTNNYSIVSDNIGTLTIVDKDE
ncbi:MAG: transglutaminase domain-containing protein [Clostridia bacterium]|nr:transglutaminase domain-containing protein [Clostridia bacterium]